MKASYLVIDTEFSGHHPHKHGLLEIAMLSVTEDFQELGVLHHFIEPPAGYEQDPEAMVINQLSQSHVTAESVSYSQLVQKIEEFIREYFNIKPILVAQFVPMDFAYLNYIFDQEGKDSLFWNDLVGHRVLDTKVLAETINIVTKNKTGKPYFESTSLSKPGGITDTLGITDYEAHTAIGDARATVQVLKQLLVILSSLYSRIDYDIP